MDHRVCKVCGKAFPKNRKLKTCSKECSDSLRNNQYKYRLSINWSLAEQFRHFDCKNYDECLDKAAYNDIQFWECEPDCKDYIKRSFNQERFLGEWALLGVIFKLRNIW